MIDIKFFGVYLFAFIFIHSFLTCGSDVNFCSYTNLCTKTVALTVPYYVKGSRESQTLDVLLNYGDLYHPREGQNGYVCEKYISMPIIATNAMQKADDDIPFLYKSFKQKRDEEFSRFQKAIVATNIPDWWISKSIEEFNYQKKCYEDVLGTYLRLKDIDHVNDSWDKWHLNQLKYLSTVTNVVEKDFDNLKYANEDFDEDGLSNFEELLCGSAPFLKNGVVIEPGIIEIIPDGRQVITNSFFVNNLTETNIVLTLQGPSTIDKHYAPKVIIPNNLLIENNSHDSYLNWLLKFPPKKKTEILVLFDPDFLPFEMLESYNIKLLDELSVCRGEIKMHISGDHSKTLSKPFLLGPESGITAGATDNIQFSWDSNENYDFKYGNENTVLFKVQFYDLERNRSIDLSITHDQHSSKCFGLSGNYIWRVLKGTPYTKSVASEWRWFSIGKEIISSEKGHKPFSQFYTYKDKSGSIINEHIVNQKNNYEQPLYSTNEVNNCFFKMNLPDGLNIEKRDGFWTVFGYPQKEGQYKYSWIVKKNRRNH